MNPQPEGQIEPVVLPDVATQPHPTASAIPQPPADVPGDGRSPAAPPAGENVSPGPGPHHLPQQVPGKEDR